MSLSNQQKKYLRGLSHRLHAVVTVADKGLTENVLSEFESALNAHELIKARLRCDREQRAVHITKILHDTGSELVHSIGQTACFYRRNPETPKIVLPDANSS